MLAPQDITHTRSNYQVKGPMARHFIDILGEPTDVIMLMGNYIKQLLNDLYFAHCNYCMFLDTTEYTNFALNAD